MSLNSIASMSKNNFEAKLFSIVSLGFDKEINSEELPLYKMNNLIVNYRTREHIFSAGTVNTGGSFLIPSQNTLGVSVKRNSTLIVNPHIQYGTPIQVNVSEPSIVEVTKDNAVIYSKFFPPGNYFLDTESLPSGVYPIKIKTTTLYGQSKLMNRLFIKKENFPAIGKNNYSFMIGLPPDTEATASSIFPVYHENNPIFLASYSWRLSKYNAIEITSVSDISYTAGAIELSRFGSFYQLNIGGFFASEQGIGESISATLENIGGLSISMTARNINDKKNIHSTTDIAKTSPLDMLQESQTSLDIVTSYTFLKNTVSIAYDYTTYHSKDREREYELSLNYSRSLFNTSGTSGDFSFNTTKTQTGYSFLASINIQISGKSIKQTISIIGDRPDGAENYRQALNYKIDYDLTDDLSTSATANLKRKPKKDHGKFIKQLESSYIGELNYKPYNLQAQILAQHLPNHDYGYLFNGSTSKTWGYAYSHKNGITTTLDMPYTSGAFVRVNSPAKDSKFHVTVDEDKTKTIQGNSNYFFSLPPYKHHRIQISSASEETFYKIENLPDYLLLYPSNIFPVIVSAKEFFILITVLVDEQDIPIVNASIKLGTEFDNNTDEFGETQIEVSKGDKIRVTYKKETKECYLIVPNQATEGGVLMLDKLTCTAKNIA